MLVISKEVQSAINQNQPIVALESTIISHGLPKPTNLQVAQDVEEIVRQNGAAAATIAVIAGKVHVGLEPDQLELIANANDVVKASVRDLAIVQTLKQSAATTVSATAHIAHLAGIKVFATGGLGGVHRGQNYDESADLIALSNTPIVVISAGVKSILDVGATLERLETFAVPVLGFKTNIFPGFYLKDSGFTLDTQVDSVDQIAEIFKARQELQTNNTAMVVANPASNQMNPELHDKLLTQGLSECKKQNVIGKAVTPFLLEYFHSNSNGESLRINIEIIKSNAKLAAQISQAISKK
jgi:pseudouridine-5'-phosphate glycosidase